MARSDHLPRATHKILWLPQPAANHISFWATANFALASAARAAHSTFPPNACRRNPSCFRRIMDVTPRDGSTVQANQADPSALGQIDLVFLCAGRGARVALDNPKQFVDLCGKPVMIHSLEVYEGLPFIGRKIIVHDLAQKAQIQENLGKYQISNCTLVAGGLTRQESVRSGIACATTPRVLTHNAAVPLVTREMIELVMQPGADCVTTATEIKDSLVRVDREQLTSISRKGLFIVNSPQVFRTDAIRQAHESAASANIGFNSDAELMLHYGYSVRLVPGAPWSFKITDRVDLALAETILKRPDLFPAFER